MGEYFGNSGVPGWVGHVELEEIKMGYQNQLFIEKSSKWRFLFAMNIFILCLFWFLALTDYSWYENWFSLLFSLLVASASLMTFFMLGFLNRPNHFLVFLVCMLTFLMALASIVLHRYHSHDTPIQVEISPDGTKLVEVYCSFTPAHVIGVDHIEITLRYRSLPFLQRDLGLYNNTPRHCNFDASNLVRWDDNDTIYVFEKQAYLSVNTINGEGALFNPGEIDGNH